MGQGALVLTGLAALLGIGLARRDQLQPSAPGPRRLELTGRNWHVLARGRRRGELPEAGEPLTVFGELVSASGHGLGEFHATSVFVAAPLGATAQAASFIETHHFNLKDGALIGTGTVSPSGPGRFAIVGGTGRYEGALGSYEAVQNPLEIGGDGTATFKFDLTLRGGM
jgi:hypothetical protein